MRTARATLVRILVTGLLAGGLLPQHGRTAIAATRCTLDRAISTAIDPKPFLMSGYNVRWNASIDWLALMQTDASGYYRVFTVRPGRMLVAGTVAVSPAGDFMLGDVQENLIRQTGLVKLVRFNCP